jgi:hypothetical protein
MELYRFQSINKNTIHNLLSNANWATDPSDFNDPLEFSHQNEKLVRHEKGEKTPMTPMEIKKYFGVQNVLKKIGVVCYSRKNSLAYNDQEVYTSKLFWSHYADSHKGMCLVFDIKNKDEYPHKVQYKSEPLRICLKSDDISNDDILPIVTTKDIEWSYEAEYREVSFKKKHWSTL